MSVQTLEILKATKELLSDEKRWTRDFLARHENGNPIGPNEPNAVCFCILGAIDKLTGTNGKYSPAHVAIEQELPKKYIGIGHFNDDPETTHGHVMAVLQKAIISEEMKTATNTDDWDGDILEDDDSIPYDPVTMGEKS
jgi:hypothetical protein